MTFPALSHLDDSINGKICTFKLTSGEEVIAKVISDDSENWLLLEHPVSVAPGPQGMGLVPSMFTGDTAPPIRLNINTVTMYVLTDSMVQNKYIEATTGIKLPEKQLIMG